MATEVSVSTLQGHDAPPRRPDTGESEAERETSLLDILIVVAERKRMIFLVTAITAVLAVIVSLLLPKRYTATVTLLPPQQNSSLGAVLSSELGGLGGMAALAGGGLGLKSPNDIYIAMLKSPHGRRCHGAALQVDVGVQGAAPFRYAQSAGRSHDNRWERQGWDDPDSLYDRDPNRAAELANGYVEQFRDLSEHLAITEASQRRLFFEKQLKQAKDNLAESEEALKRTEQKTGVIQLDSQARALIESAASIRAQIAAKQVQIQAMQNYAAGENAQLLQAQTELQGMRAQLAKLGGGAGENGDDIIVPKGRVTELDSNTCASCAT